ncbi:hypothetical protein M9Y10_035748 [Tritrichomonas musculus]|uniref:Uncharacterized protein n=1 Tax=Tritrichomonas musculus TaxID=1915356 RepID=A0ABR2GYL1_9EUKA
MEQLKADMVWISSLHSKIWQFHLKYSTLCKLFRNVNNSNYYFLDSSFSKHHSLALIKELNFENSCREAPYASARSWIHLIEAGMM